MSLCGKTIVFSGTLSMKRAEARKLAIDAGAKVTSAISGNTDILVAGPGAGGKITDAETYSVEVWSEEDFQAALEEDKPAPKRKTATKAAKKAAPKRGKAAASEDEEDEAPPAKKVKKAASAKKRAADLHTRGVVDIAVEKYDKKLFNRAVVFVTDEDEDESACYDVKLALVEPKINSDKFYILQLIHDEKEDEYYVVTRWGRTGTSGRSQVLGPFDMDEAVDTFDHTFMSKVGKIFSRSTPGEPPKKGKYQHLRTKKGSPTDKGKWQYYLTSDPAGKPDGWYDYDDENAKEVEMLSEDFKENPTLSTRFVHAESSGFTYKVNIKDGTQTNVSSGKERPIRRVSLKK